MGELIGAFIIMFVLFFVIRTVLQTVIVIETHRILISCMSAGVLGEILYFVINGIISLYYILAVFIIYLIELVRYNLRLRKSEV